MGELRHLIPLLVIGGGMSFVGALFYGTWLLGRYRGRDDNLPGDAAAMDARLQHLERALMQNTAAIEALQRSLGRQSGEPNRVLPRSSETTPH
jgi:hypothetical protein